MDGWTIAAVLLLLVFLLAVPLLLAALGYRAAKTGKKWGAGIWAGALALSVFMPVYTVYLGTVLLIAYKTVLRGAADKRAWGQAPGHREGSGHDGTGAESTGPAADAGRGPDGVWKSDGGTAGASVFPGL